MHGGLVSALLDEILGRTAIANDIWCMTAQLDVRYKKPVPIGTPLKLKGEIVKRKGKVIEGKGELLLADLSVDPFRRAGLGVAQHVGDRVRRLRRIG